MLTRLKPVRTLNLIALAAATYVVYVVCAIAMDGPLVPTPLNSVILLTLSTGSALTTCWWVAGWLDERNVKRKAVFREHVDKRIDDAIATLSALIVESRGGTDGGLDAYARGYADGLAHKPMAESNVRTLTGRG